MNEYVLRGFCKKCEQSVIMTHRGSAPHQYSTYDAECGLSEPVWFLSARQMQIVWNSKEAILWWHNQKTRQGKIWILLYEEPFLVAKILKDAGEKSKEENK